MCSCRWIFFFYIYKRWWLWTQQWRSSTTSIRFLSRPCPRQNEHSATYYPLKWRGQPPFPMYFVGDEAFPLQEHIMRPYHRRCLTNPRRIFNKDHPQQEVLNVHLAFWCQNSVFEGPFSCSPDKVEDITKAACVLHNYFRHHDRVLSTPQELANG